jgi:hypothetical protein
MLAPTRTKDIATCGTNSNASQLGVRFGAERPQRWNASPHASVVTRQLKSRNRNLGGSDWVGPRIGPNTARVCRAWEQSAIRFP